MAAITPTKHARQAGGLSNFGIDRWSGTSATNSSDTLTAGLTTETAVRRLGLVTAKYSGSASVTVTTTIIYTKEGAAYSTVIDSQALSSATDYKFIPATSVWLFDGDQVQVSVPALSGGTAAVCVELEVV